MGAPRSTRYVALGGVSTTNLPFMPLLWSDITGYCPFPPNSQLPEGRALFLLAIVPTAWPGARGLDGAQGGCVDGFLPCFAEGCLAVQLAFCFQLTLFLGVG